MSLRISNQLNSALGLLWLSRL